MLTRPRHSAAAFAGALLSIFSVVCGASTARAQVNYTEPPDLSTNLNNPTPVGTVALGLNTVSGGVSDTWDTGGSFGIDKADSFSFTVPPGVVVTGIQLVVTSFACNNCTSDVQSSTIGINTVNITGNGTFTLPVFGPLGAGIYDAQARVGQNSSFVAGSGSYSYQFRITATAATNDLCQFATAINLGATPFNNTTATTDGVAHAAACNFSNRPTIAKDLWYAFTPTLSGVLTVSTCGSTFDTEVNVYNGGTGICPGSDATLLACNDDNAAACGTGSLQSQVVVTVVAGQPYLIRVGSFDAVTPTSGAGTLTLSQVTTGACCNRWTGNCTVRGQLDCTSQGLRFDGFGVACSPTTCKACPADFNGTGGISVPDIFDFLSAWFAGCP